MKRHLFIFLFFTGFVPLGLSVPRKYYLIQQGKTWSAAQAYCRATHNDLAIIESDDNLVQLQYEAERQHFSSSAWIGLYNAINTWRWSMGNVSLGTAFWCGGQPNNLGGHQFCGAIGPWNWNDEPCYALLPSVCFDGTKPENESYIYISNLMSWSEAQAYCRKYYTDLATIRNATENTFVVKMTYGWTWFGLFRDAWKWTDQNNFTNTTITWMPGKPNNLHGNDNCGYLNNGQVVDAQCSGIMPFYCYSFTTGKKQIMKVKVQSKQDVNNPAVKEAILEQIKQTLQDYGMAEDTTVKWRNQPDGVVFHKEEESAIASSICSYTHFK